MVVSYNETNCTVVNTTETDCSFSFLLETRTPGTYEYGFEFFIRDSTNDISCVCNGDVIVNLTDFGNNGEYISLSFNGTFFDDLNQIEYEISGKVNVIRDF